MRIWPFQREKKENPVGRVISAYGVGQAVWTERNYGKLSDEGFVRNAVAYRCVKMIANNAATIPWLLKTTKGETLEAHKLLDLLKRPAPMIGGHQLFEAFYAYLLLAGNSYLAAPALAGGSRPPKEMWTLRPDRMQIIAGRGGVPQAYRYEANGQREDFPVDAITGRSDILHMKEFHPLNDWYGLSRIEPAAYGVDRHNAASEHNKALLDNGARPTGILSFLPIKIGSNTQSAPQSVVEAARQELENSHGGPMNAGKPMVTSGDVNWQEMGISPRDMDFGMGKNDAARDICYAFGVPDLLIVPGQSTYNNVSEAKLDLWEQTILPIVDNALDLLNNTLVPRFGDNLRLGVDLDEISALEPRRTAKRKSITEIYDKGIISRCEARDALQYGEEDEDAVRLQRGDGQVLTALVTAAQADPAMVEPLYRFLVSVALIDVNKTSLEAFVGEWEGGTIDASTPEALAASIGQETTLEEEGADPTQSEGE